MWIFLVITFLPNLCNYHRYKFCDSDISRIAHINSLPSHHPKFTISFFMHFRHTDIGIANEVFESWHRTLGIYFFATNNLSSLSSGMNYSKKQLKFQSYCFNTPIKLSIPSPTVVIALKAKSFILKNEKDSVR